MSLSPTLRFDFVPEADRAQLNDGWGSGSLYLNGAPFWYANTDSQPERISWTWVDLLEHVAQNWTSLVSVQSYPFSWLRGSPQPSDSWSLAERRWARMDEVAADEEEAVLLAFERRHNLAAAFKGLSLPALSLLRTGHVVWIFAEGKVPIRAPFNECRDALVGVCDAMADAFKNSTNSRVVEAVLLWKNRGEALRQNYLSVASGLPPQMLSTVQGREESFSFWEVVANSSWASGDVVEGELLAAARMTAGLLNADALGSVLRIIKGLTKRNTAALDELGGHALGQLRRNYLPFAFQAGYMAAEIIRDKAPNHRGKYFDIANCLERLAVEVIAVKLQAPSIDAIAVWGSRGPCVVLNEDRAHSNSPERTRMTLAHELGHLLIDRQGGLPFCEVLGGLVDAFMERRASAFAAELLLPRSAVEHEWTLWKGTFNDFLSTLKQVFGVSKSVACAQIYNSNLFRRLDSRLQDVVERRLRLEDELHTRQDLKVEAAGTVV